MSRHFEYKLKGKKVALYAHNLAKAIIELRTLYDGEELETAFETLQPKGGVKKRNVGIVPWGFQQESDW